METRTMRTVLIAASTALVVAAVATILSEGPAPAPTQDAHYERLVRRIEALERGGALRRLRGEVDGAPESGGS